MTEIENPKTPKVEQWIRKTSARFSTKVQREIPSGPTATIARRIQALWIRLQRLAWMISWVKCRPCKCTRKRIAPRFTKTLFRWGRQLNFRSLTISSNRKSSIGWSTTSDCWSRWMRTNTEICFKICQGIVDQEWCSVTWSIGSMARMKSSRAWHEILQKGICHRFRLTSRRSWATSRSSRSFAPDIYGPTIRWLAEMKKSFGASSTISGIGITRKPVHMILPSHSKRRRESMSRLRHRESKDKSCFSNLK